MLLTTNIRKLNKQSVYDLQQTQTKHEKMKPRQLVIWASWVSALRSDALRCDCFALFLTDRKRERAQGRKVSDVCSIMPFIVVISISSLIQPWWKQWALRQRIWTWNEQERLICVYVCLYPDLQRERVCVRLVNGSLITWWPMAAPNKPCRRQREGGKWGTRGWGGCWLGSHDK